MENKKCPACGELLGKTAGVCGKCGLKELDRIFLSRGEYDEWVKQVLLPHKASLVPRVFAGDEHLLILTGDGRLYGLGSNRSGQISETAEPDQMEPLLMATGVTDAAAGCNYTIYITRDGQVHLQGRGVYAERFPGFSGAERVFAQHDSDMFWIADRQGQIYFFGRNERWDGPVEFRETVLQVLPEQTCVVEYGTNRMEFDNGTQGRSIVYHGWSTTYEQRSKLEMAIRSTGEYRQLVRELGNDNVELTMTLVSSQVLDGKTEADSERRERHTYLPEIWKRNSAIFEPVLCREPLDLQTPHRKGSMPMALEEPDAEKVCTMHGHRLIRYRDGTVLLRPRYGQEHPLDWEGRQAGDLALSCTHGIVAYRNGDLIRFNLSYFPDAFSWEESRVPIILPGAPK